MTRTCTVCAHPDRGAIDAALVAGDAYRDIARRFGPSKDALARHRDEHLPATLAQAKEAGEVAQAGTLLAQLRDLQTRALRVLGAAEEAGDLRTALGAIAQARGNIELLAKLLGELDERPQVNVLVDPEWLAVRSALLGALAPFPQARVAVAAALHSLEAGNGHRG